PGAGVATWEDVTNRAVGFPTVTIANTIAATAKTETAVFATREETTVSQAFPITDCSDGSV
ncbi:MAG: hypothetical protein WCA28_23245, partial [Bradyrhizobium sp.]